MAAGINAQRDVVGYYTDSGGHQHGFFRDARGWTSIDYPGACRTDALGINEAGDIVGTYFPQPAAGHSCPTSNQVPGIHGYLLRDGLFTSIDVAGATFTGAIDINAEGDIVGHFQDTKAPAAGARFTGSDLVDAEKVTGLRAVYGDFI